MEERQERDAHDQEAPYRADLNPYAPVRIGPSIPHYYGDYVRQLFIFCAAAMLVLAPFLSRDNFFLLSIEVIGAVVVVVLGALTNPKNKIALLADAIVAGIGVVVYELLALALYTQGEMLAFLAREVVAMGFLFALYFSLKTFRNMLLDVVGTRHRVTPLFTMKNRGDGD